MSQTITLYVDGACRGNPGLGGWGAYITHADHEQKLYGGEAHTTNNRMELTAAIEGILACNVDAKLIIWTDSKYVKDGITQWIHGWKKKNWKDVKNPDLWQKLDQVCHGREIEWNWVKGHAGHAGNEMADHLANLGADQTHKQNSTKENSMQDTKKPESDWLLDDPFGFDTNEDALADEEIELNTEAEAEAEAEALITAPAADATQTSSIHPAIKLTPASYEVHGKRQLILDTETTGFYYQNDDRIVEVGAIEMINRKLTGSSIHIYIRPDKSVGDSVEIHGITDEFLADKPAYADIAATLFDYLKGAEIIAHNATFDMNFLNMEFQRVGLPTLSSVCDVTDTLALAKSKHPGQKNSLDALVRRYEIPARDRTYHGALLDAEILSDVYLAMTGGQVSFDMDALSHHEQNSNHHEQSFTLDLNLPVIEASAQELEAHQQWVAQYEQKHGKPCFFAE
ncbi:DNA polymerase III subunit epsilon [Acinetobacter sp. MD2(2019)]|uniref:DNA polymerase III subunit epsilon n=1 Tax=Acinetobacter sp. MD2(2019) TaxID=2605273 RepID=UPI002D1EAF9F|nr:DNA polymerase III subunit epsilon [Acinetobacter sp. MD2(2019)]MEB3753738.1 DNA polymerase III subunit epsilon [Acinetobacter sp. MD2(2019)]